MHPWSSLCIVRLAERAVGSGELLTQGLSTGLLGVDDDGDLNSVPIGI